MAITVFAAAALGLASLSTEAADTPKDLILAQAQPFIGTQGFVAPQGNYMTTANGCTYRKTQAPGHPPRWILVVNPHHVGGKFAGRQCQGML